MKKYIVLIVYLVISIGNLNANTYNTYNQNVYGNPYAPTYNFKSTSSNIQNINYNTVKPLNRDGTVSIEYTTHKNAYKPRYNYGGLDVDPDDEIIGELVPIGDPDLYLIILLVLPYILYNKIKIKRF